ncbi:hypothetical protein TNCV_4114671 [Trichonephila clavipes]|nr:hypothetical protein TNCV_4114671 [Trichonephila clavipes]
MDPFTSRYRREVSTTFRFNNENENFLASPAHLLDCWGISLRQLYEEQDLVCDTITLKGQMDFVWAFLLQGDWKQQQQQQK